MSGLGVSVFAHAKYEQAMCSMRSNLELQLLLIRHQCIVLWHAHIFSPGESGNGSSLASCLVRSVAVGGDSGGGKRGDSRRACPRPESSDS